MESIKSKTYIANISNNPSAPVAYEILNNKNINYNNHIIKKYSKNNFKIQISPFYIDKLKTETYIDIIKFIKNFCDLTLKSNFDYKNNIFKIKKKKAKKSNYFNYKIVLTKEERNKIKEECEKKILEKHKEIKRIDEDEIRYNFDMNNDVGVKNGKNEIKINDFENNINDSDDSSIENETIYCKIHNKTFLTKQAYNNHCKSKHKYKCLKCGEILQTIIKVQNHLNCCNTNNNKLNKNETDKLKTNININKNKNTDYDLNENSMKSKNEKNDESQINKKESKVNNIQKNDIKSIKEENNINNNNFKENQKKEQEDFKKEEDIKMQNEVENNKNEKEGTSYYYECYRDRKIFQTEKNYVKHFKRCHPNDFPFYCDQCNKGFFSYNSIETHNRKEGHN